MQNFNPKNSLNDEKVQKSFEVPSKYSNPNYNFIVSSLNIKHSSNILLNLHQLSNEELTKIKSIIEKEKCDLPHAYLWLKVKLQLVDILFSQARYDEVIIHIDNAKTECDALNDTFYTRIFNQYIILIKASNGSITESLDMYYDIKQHAEQYSHKDIELIKFYANVAEVLFDYQKSSDIGQKAQDIFKLSRDMLREYLLTIGLELENVYDTSYYKIENQKSPKFALHKNKLIIDENSKTRQLARALAANESSVLDKPENLNFEDVLDFSNELFYELFYLDKMDNRHQYANTKYLIHLETMIKLDIRYVYTLCKVSSEYDEA